MNRIAHCLLLFLAIPLLAWPKDELIPTRPKSRDRQGPPNPLHDLSDDMHAVGRRLDEAKTDDTTQQAERAILEKLDELIEQARQQSQSPQSNQGDSQQRQQKQQQQQQQKEQQAKQQQNEEQKKKAAEEQKQKQSERPGIGRAGSGDPTGALHTDAQEWGNLPPSIREQLLQTQGEGFPLKYRELLRRYYRELFKPRE